VPHAPDPIRWGIVGTANIARAQFLPGLREAGGGRATSVASRDLAKAEAYATAHGIDRGMEGYASLVDSPDIDAVYVALPNALHAEPTIQALRAGKAVSRSRPPSGTFTPSCGAKKPPPTPPPSTRCPPPACWKSCSNSS